MRSEIEAYGVTGLPRRPEIVALSQADILDDELREALAGELQEACGRKPLVLSAVSGLGMTPALRALRQTIGETVRLEHRNTRSATGRNERMTARQPD